MPHSPAAAPAAGRTDASVAEVRELILAGVAPLGSETVGLAQAGGRVLAEAIRAERPIPPLANSAMDGYAVRAADTQHGPAELAVVAHIPAGPRRPLALLPGQAARIFTGAPIPEGADAVVMQEYAQRRGEQVLLERPAKPGDHIRLAGSDVQAGQLVMEPGERLTPAHLGMLAALGRSQVSVGARPRVAVLATGDELVEPDRLRDDGRIASSNSYSLCAALRAAGAEPHYLGIVPDDPPALQAAFEGALRFDAVISTGGVSVGDHDWIAEILARLGGGRRQLWRIRMKPGAPLAFTQVGRTPVFGLPGNPVSSLVTFEQFVRPALLRMSGQRALYRPVERAVLAEDYHKPAGRLHFVRVRCERRAGRLYAIPSGDQSSAVLLAVLRADALAIAAEDATELPAGSEIPIQWLHRDDLREEPGF
jgi:molybdopterin molybdotransferase